MPLIRHQEGKGGMLKRKGRQMGTRPRRTRTDLVCSHSVRFLSMIRAVILEGSSEAGLAPEFGKGNTRYGKFTCDQPWAYYAPLK